MNKIEVTNEHDFKVRNFGNLVSKLRKKLDLTQEEFSKIIMISRVTTVKVEKVEDVKELSDDLLFRLNFLSFRLMTNKRFDDLVRLSAEKVYNITYTTLSERIIDNVDSPFLKSIVKS